MTLRSVTRVLVLDDDATLAELMRVVLKEAGYEAVAATSVGELPDGPFACVVTDLLTVFFYDVADARDYLSLLADRYPSVPVIVVTGHAQAYGDATRLGARRVIMKPFDVDWLTNAVREAITS